MLPRYRHRIVTRVINRLFGGVCMRAPRARRTLSSAVVGALILSGAFGAASARQEAAGTTARWDERAVPVLNPGGRHVLLLMLDGLPVVPFEAALAAHE